jgi:hypothetical protein
MVGRVVFASDNADGEIGPGNEEGAEQREAESGSIGGQRRNPDGELEQAADGAEHDPPDDEVLCGPVHLGRELHCDERQKQQRRSDAPSDEPPRAAATFAEDLTIHCHSLFSVHGCCLEHAATSGERHEHAVRIC